MGDVTGLCAACDILSDATDDYGNRWCPALGMFTAGCEDCRDFRRAQTRQTRTIFDMVIADMRERDRIGRERYGSPLLAHNGRDALRDAYEEALDLAVYLRQVIEERTPMADPRDIPMIFTGKSVRDIHAGRKRCTRRLVKWPRPSKRNSLCPCPHCAEARRHTQPPIEQAECPWHRGDRLWVKEACFLAGYDGDEYPGLEYWIYKADYEPGEPSGVRWRSPRFMPKRACRCWLRVERVEAEHIQDITDEGAQAEGYATQAEFCAAWDRMHKPPDDMAGNPWVFLVWFELLEGTNG